MNSEVLEKLRANPLFGRVDAAVLQKILPHCQSIKYRAGRKILRERGDAEHVFCLVSGGVRIYHVAPDGEEGEIVVKLFRAPAFFGEMEVLMRMAWLETVETVMPSEVIRISGQAFTSLLSREPKLCFALVRDLTLRLCIATEHARVLAFSDVESRLASLVLDHVNLFGIKDEATGAIRIDVKLSQETLARSLAASRKAINQTFGRWKAEGLLDKRAARYIVLDLDGLRARALEAKYGLAYQLPE